MSRPRVAAHRGGAALWPENSLLAVREALSLGVPLVEVDVHLAADGMPVVIHDATLDRTTDGRGRIAERGWPDLRARRLRGPDGGVTDEPLPTLDDVLAVLAPSRAGLLLELKGPAAALGDEEHDGEVRVVPGPCYEGLEAVALMALRAHAMDARTTILAFNPAVLAVVRALAPRQAVMLLVSQRRVERTGCRPEDAMAWASAAGATAIGLEHTVVDARVVAAAREAGLAIGVWTVNGERAMRRFADLAVDVVTTDRPDLALRVLGGG